MGPHAFLVECNGVSPAAVADGIRSSLVRSGDEAGPVDAGLVEAGLVEVVPAATTVLVECDDRAAADRLRAAVVAMDHGTVVAAATNPTIKIPVDFDGDDLDDVAARIGRNTEGVIELVLAADLRVAFCGFAPGFAYLEGLDPILHLPRRSRPRTRVPAGSVAIAAGYAAVYPGASPGGWHLLGRTDTEVWSLDRDPPALLAPGTSVRFVAVSGSGR